jgi:hypothetical protein
MNTVLSDSQIVERLATEVMGLRWKPYGIVRSIGGWIDVNGTDYGYWNPLTDWNNTMEVVEKSHGDPEKLADIAFRITKENNDPQRAICLAALATLGSFPPEK